MKKRLITIFAVVSLLATTGIAMAAEEDPEDTVLNYGYDEENQVFVWGAHPTDGLYDCSIEVEGSLAVTYQITNELVFVGGLFDGEDPFEFDPTDEADLSDEFDEPATESVEYTGPDGECVHSGGDVAGPNGQINHGMFMKLVNSLYEGPGRGCVNRHIAQSDLGKGDQQVNVPDVDEEAEALEDGAEGEIDFENVLTDCKHGNADTDSEDGEGLTGQDNAAAKKAAAAERKAAKADRPRGKSADAPGKNK